MRLVLDMQGFKDETNRFLPKELATYDGHRISHHIFKHPYPLKFLPPKVEKQAVYLMKNHHCINWNEGYTYLHNFPMIIEKLTKEATVVYVKGEEKADYIRKYCKKPIVEIDETPVLKPSDPKCFFHSKTPSVCALSNVLFLYETFFMNE